MAEKINLKDVQKQVYMSFTEDGLIDLSIGLVIFGFAALLMVGQAWMVGLLGGIPLLIWYSGKRLLTYPRSGSIETSREMKSRTRNYTFALLISGLGVLAFIIVIAASGRSFLADHSLALFGLVLALGISTLAILTKANRLFLYAVLVFAAMAIGEVLNQPIGTIDVFLLSVLIAGAIIILAGILILVSFLRKYPVISLDE
jgi:hypothetical protein